MALDPQIKRLLRPSGFKDIPGAATRFFARKTFKLFERVGLHITPVSYYSPIPTTYELKPEVFKKTFSGEGLDWNIETQRQFLEEVFPKYRNEYRPEENPGLSLVDAFILYAMVRNRKPRVLVEAGAGSSTFISLKAFLKNSEETGEDSRFYSVEPYPWDEIRAISAPGFELVVKRFQDVSLDLLSTADLLFIDSSHVSRIDSDVNYQILEVLPRLKPGAIVHWHDIPCPADYPKGHMDNGNMFWNEAYMVHAFLLFNRAFRVIWASHYMQLNQFDALQRAFPYLNRGHHLSSLWIERA